MKLTTEIEVEITSELQELLTVSGIDVTQNHLNALVKELNPTKAYLEIICNKSFRKVIESVNTPYLDTNKEISRLFYKILLDRFYDSQVDLTNYIFRELAKTKTYN
jgi:hypothetical protein